VCPSRGSHSHCASALREYARSVAASSHHLPSSLGAAHVASTQCTAIKRGHPLHLVYTSVVSAFGKPSPPRSPLFSTTSSVLSHLTPPRSQYAGHRASPEHTVAPRPEGPAPSPPLSSSTVDRTGELCLSVVRPPRFDSPLGIVSGRCAEVHGCFLWTSSR
jgi:hypothetical protein